jgi:hypothetical protein
MQHKDIHGNLISMFDTSFCPLAMIWIQADGDSLQLTLIVPILLAIVWRDPLILSVASKRQSVGRTDVEHPHMPAQVRKRYQMSGPLADMVWPDSQHGESVNGGFSRRGSVFQGMRHIHSLSSPIRVCQRKNRFSGLEANTTRFCRLPKQ